MVKQPYGYAGARMQWCIWHVLGTQSSGVAVATAAQHKPPEADLPEEAAVPGQYFSIQYTKPVQCHCP